MPIGIITREFGYGPDSEIKLPQKNLQVAKSGVEVGWQRKPTDRHSPFNPFKMSPSRFVSFAFSRG